MQKTHSRFLYIAVALVALLVIIFLALAYTKTKNHSSSVRQTQTPTTEQTAQENAENNQRKNDAAAIAGAVAEYGNNNAGSPPTEATAEVNNVVTLCSFDCASKTKSQATLSYYKPDKVSFRDYAAGLKVPDAQTVYIVHQAACNENEDGLSNNTDISSRASAILYAISSDSQLQQKCMNV
jgi:hypothetical protein